MINPLFDPKTDNQSIADDTQSRINAPLAGGQLSQEDRAFLNGLLALVDAGTIDLYRPSSLLNEAAYEALSPEGKAKADQNTVVMLMKIREIVQLERAPMDTNYQVDNLVKSLRQSKERVEAEAGDIFVI